MSREFTDWVRTLDELEPKGVTPETRLAPVYLAPPLRGEVHYSRWPYYLAAVLIAGSFAYDIWLLFFS